MFDQTSSPPIQSQAIINTSSSLSPTSLNSNNQPFKERHLEEHDSSCKRGRSLDDLRTKQRETIIKNRVHSKCIKLILNRKSFAQKLLLSPLPGGSSNCDEEDEDDFTDDASNDSSSTDYNAPLPRFLLEPMRKLKTQNIHKVGLFDEQSAQDQLIALCSFLLDPAGDPALQNHLIRKSSSLISYSLDLKNPDIACQTLDMLGTFSRYEPQTIIYLLQKDVLSCMNHQFQYGQVPTPVTTRALRFLIHISISAPEAIPFMIDMMHSTGTLGLLQNMFSNEETSTVHILSRLYYVLTNSLMCQLSNNADYTLLPDVITCTGVSSQTLQSYSPQTTMEKLSTGELIYGLVNQCVNKTNRRHTESINGSLLTLANIIKACHTSENRDWVITIGRSFQESGIEANIAKLSKVLQRHIRNADSEHLSQGTPESSAAAKKTLDNCGKFMNFYQEFFEPIAELMLSSV